MAHCDHNCWPYRSKKIAYANMQKCKMKVAIPIWNGFVSNVFDFAHQLLVVDAEDKKEISRSQVQLAQQVIQQRVTQLVELNANVLICGGHLLVACLDA